MNKNFCYTSFQLSVYLIFIASVSCSPTKNQNYPISEANYWTNDKREKYLKNREDSITWDKQMFDDDMKWIDDLPSGPFQEGVFPEPKYDLHGKFKGVGNMSGQYKVNGKTILMNSFFQNASTINEHYLDTLKNDVFFHIVVLTDTLDIVNYNHLSSIIISRNHPDYLGQGFYKTKNNLIDYSAFITAERESYAIVNTRLFNLKYGKTILIAPQKDKSLRSLQIKSTKISKDEVVNYTQELLKKEEIIRFFTNENAI
ncbi:hypothetical protein [Winogradskyella aurantia]|uniref:Uncharacterized protein n=1 Tax=Winogradskyella aurantia TaxID=1915063 RepID=A0A265URT9_9FLAO|nr:hypothetical protein [Winogradskyella aurantia]OZV68014.1 hypothetical protein CA834_10205 [Winogradskyella aurantia]